MGIHFYELQENDRLVFIGTNPAADRLLGVDNQAHIGKTIEEAFPPLSQTEVPEMYRQAARQGIPWETEQVSRKDKQVRSPVEMHIIINEALKLLRPAIPTTIDIQTQITSKGQILVDPTRLHQIIMNLCTNAYQAMLETGGILQLFTKSCKPVIPFLQTVAY